MNTERAAEYLAGVELAILIGLMVLHFALSSVECVR